MWLLPVAVDPDRGSIFVIPIWNELQTANVESLLPKRRSKRPAEWSVRVRAGGYISPEFNFGRKGTEGRQFLSTSPSPYPVNVQGWARNVVPT